METDGDRETAGRPPRALLSDLYPDPPRKKQEKPLPLNSNMLLYSNLLPIIRRIAGEHGYAVGVHGSMVNDLDLMLMPWVEDIRPVHTCIVAIAKACGGFMPSGGSHQVGDKWVLSEQPGLKPHDRVAWTIAFGGRVYLDISVIVPATPHVKCL